MLPPWNKIEWGLPMAGREIEFVRGHNTLQGRYEEGWFVTQDQWGNMRCYPLEQITEWRYLDEVHEG